MYEVRITSVLNGFVCKIGCQTVVFNSIETMLDELGKYLVNPSEMEKRYVKSSLNSGKLRCDTVEEEAPTPRHEYPSDARPAGLAGQAGSQ